MSELYLFANVNFVPDKYGDWQAAYDELAEYVWNKEHTTKTYYFGIPFDYADNISATTLMFAFEVYENRDGLTETHLKSPAMAAFLNTVLPIMSTGLDLAHYAKFAGFLDSHGDSRECSVMHDMRIHCSSAAARDTVALKLTQLAQEIDADQGVLTWVACRALDDDKELRVFSRFRSREVMEKFERSEGVLRLWKEVGHKEVATMSQRGYVPNGKGWLHR